MTAIQTEVQKVNVGVTNANDSTSKAAIDALVDLAIAQNYSTNIFECPLPVGVAYRGVCTSFEHRIWQKSEDLKGQILTAKMQVETEGVKREIRINFNDAVLYKSLGIGSEVVFNVVLVKNQRTAQPVSGVAAVTTPPKAETAAEKKAREKAEKLAAKA